MWSFQRADVFKDIIQAEIIYLPGWTHISDPWRKAAYHWMRGKMLDKGILMGSNAPFWAWKHTCNPATHISLFTTDDMASNREYVVVEFDHGVEAGLESSYLGFTNVILALKKGYRSIDPAIENDAFTMRSNADIQIALPFFDTRTITSTRGFIPTPSMHSNGPTTALSQPSSAGAPEGGSR